MSNNQHTLLSIAVYTLLVTAAWVIAYGFAQLLNNLTQ